MGIVVVAVHIKMNPTYVLIKFEYIIFIETLSFLIKNFNARYIYTNGLNFYIALRCRGDLQPCPRDKSARTPSIGMQ